MDLSPHHLRTFLAVRRHLNFSRAAEELGLSQPAVTRHIQLLNRDLGVRLFEQVGRRVFLSAAGDALAGEAERLLADLERLGERVRAHASADRGRLRVGAATTPGYYLLPAALGRLRRERPEIDLRYEVSNTLAIEQKVLRNELDVAFVGGHLSAADLRLDEVAADEIVCFARPDHPLTSMTRVAPSRLREAVWISREEGSATRRLFESWLADAGAGMDRVITVESPEAIKRLVMEGVGVSYMSVHGLAEELRGGRLARIPVSGLRLRRPIYGVRHRDKHLSPPMAAFLDTVRAVLGPPEHAAPSIL